MRQDHLPARRSGPLITAMNPPSFSPRAALWALFAGNFAIGTGVLLPAGILNDLTAGLALTPARAGLLLFVGGIVIGFGAPVFATLTNRIDRRPLLVASLALYVVGHALVRDRVRLHDPADHPCRDDHRRRHLHAAGGGLRRANRSPRAAGAIRRFHLRGLVRRLGGGRTARQSRRSHARMARRLYHHGRAQPCRDGARLALHTAAPAHRALVAGRVAHGS